MLLSSTMYDKIKFIVQIALPVLAVLYFTISLVFVVPFVEQVLGFTFAVIAFLGVMLHVSTNRYRISDAKYDGAIVVNTDDPDKDLYTLETFGDPENLIRTKGELLFQVRA